MKRYYRFTDGFKTFVKCYTQAEAEEAVKSNGWRIIEVI